MSSQEEFKPQQIEIEKLHSSKTLHNYEVNFSVMSKTNNFLDALLEIDSNELGDQIKKLIKEENRQYTIE